MDNITIDFITTACNRPELLNKTYSSFVSKLKGINFMKSTLYINIDPAPNNNEFSKMVEIAKRFFGNVVVNNPETPNFAKAVKWCTSQTKEKYVFYLEDDWTLSQDINIQDLIKILENDSTIKKVQLRNKHVSNNCPGNKDRFGLPPGLWDAEFLRNFSKTMNGNINPESQIVQYQRNLRKEGTEVKKVIYGDEIIIHDIGRWWLKQNKLKRDYNNNEDKWSPWITWKKSN